MCQGLRLPVHFLFPVSHSVSFFLLSCGLHNTYLEFHFDLYMSLLLLLFFLVKYLVVFERISVYSL